MMRFACPHCGLLLSAPEMYAGRVTKCKCGQPFTVPQVPANPSGPPSSRWSHPRQRGVFGESLMAWLR